MSGDGNQNTDTTSFASILAGVQRLRGDNNQSDASSTLATSAPVQPITRKPDTTRQAPPPASSSSSFISTPQLQKRTNAFNQDRTSYNDPRFNKRARDPNIPKPSSISVNKSQTGNPLLQNITNVNWNYVESRNIYDYLIKNRQIIFLSLKYHKLHPEYIQNKMKPLMKKDAILLTVVDIENSESILKELNRICLYNEFTLLLAFNFEQAAKYLTYMATSV
ncbi:DNA excision repair protein [Wickerhamomyces ciferrii]|uniref:DNA excision repair protein n=1 Tax=Wickerhamomyces ciferrii (strain ATCC 14091 / BCRC 22168 / CBS 111 / JCM 3599 / NBRC 0793 / NRRL Y-1031 F-60-10) TaxID=1206466 RepID=K0KQN7_WICCF|nr:DNA excision repair protein [Wickerhamomyces ciferrii]CCH45376.1 DNA excision repair protein [Wickerhamomyces ciferrii]